jgi:hypothetical protein
MALAYGVKIVVSLSDVIADAETSASMIDFSPASVRSTKATRH